VNKYICFCVLLLMALGANAQRKPAANTRKSVVNLIQSRSSVGIKRNGVDVIKVYQGTFQQEYSKLSSDSAYFYAQNNSFDAFGHVVINQGDTLNIYADKLNYNGNTHTAILTDNVRMVDKDATLTTNYLTYNTATRTGTYTGGGKLVNKQNTLVSKNGYYYAFTRDAFFRYDVVLTTVDAVIKTDTLHYNSGSRIAYFLGPSHIYGNKNKDTLYSENGNYNTITEQAFFGRKNRYAQGTKTLKGDSLFYDRLKGFGRAIGRVTFNDREQKITIKGDLGNYFNADERAVVTKNAYVILETEQTDSTKADTAGKKVAAKDSTKVVKQTDKNRPAVAAATKPAAAAPTAAGDTTQTKRPVITPPARPRSKIDSVYIGADTLETQILTFKALKLRQESMRPNKLRDSLAKLAKTQRVPLYLKSTAKHIYSPPMAGIPRDSGALHRDIFGPPRILPVDTAKQKQAKATAKKPAAPKVKKADMRDSVYMNVGYKVNLSDTSRIRILSAHHHALLFKSDLQGKADSMFYSASDSIIRLYVKPMLWTQGSQLSGDTIHLQMRNRKLNNMELFPNAFTVNIEENDSTHFNQVAGKRMRGFFVDNKMSQMYVDGNAETIYFNRDSGRVTEMQRSLTSRIKVNFRDNKVANVKWLIKPEFRYGPISKFKEDERLLKNFIWKPKDRPVSKEYVIRAYSRRQAEARANARKPKAPTAKPAAGKAATAAGAKPGTAIGTAVTKPVVGSSIKPVLSPDSSRTSGVKPSVKDSTTNRNGTINPAAKDTTRANPKY
jgi:lipopolysaccharide export system protein LptA